MGKRSPAIAAVVLAIAALSLVVVHPGVSAAAAPVRVMPLGDSITGSPGCWRAVLWNRLRTAGFTEVDFVGTLPPQGCAVAHDGDNEGHGGILATNMAGQNQLVGWLAATRPDVVLMHLGTNDVWSNRSTAQILDAFSTLLAQMRASNPSIRLLVAQIIPMAPNNCAECGARVVALNNALPGWAAARSTAQSPVIVVDQWTGFSTSADTTDGVHPNAGSGTQKMADRWYPALAGVLGGVPPTNPPTGPPTGPPTNPPPTGPPTSPPTGPPVGGACTAAYAVIGQWQGAFQAEVTIRNPGTAAIPTWVARWTFANGQQVTQSWNTDLTQSGGAVTARPVGWNASIPAGGTQKFGFIANGTGATGASTVTCTTS